MLTVVSCLSRLYARRKADDAGILPHTHRERERDFNTSIQPAWLMRTDLCSRLGYLQNGCEAMADSLLVFVPDACMFLAFC